MVFGRKVELTVGSNADSIKITSLKISFDVTCERGSVFKADVQVYNLSSETQKRYIKKNARVRLVVGYERGLGYGVVFDGNLTKVDKETSPPDTKFTIYCDSHADLYTKPYSLRLKSTSAHQIISMIRRETTYQIDVNNLPNKGYESFNSHKTPLETLRLLASDVGYELVFGLQGKLYFREKQGAVYMARYEIDDMVLQTPIEKENEPEGELLSFETILNYRYSLQSLITLRTSFYNGEIELKELGFSGDNQDGEFKCSMVGYPKGSRKEVKGYYALMAGR